MTIATLMATCAVFLVVHWTANAYAVLALTIGGVVCIAAAIAGATSQDLKTGYLVGATPYRQQIALIIGVLVSSFAIGGTLILMNIGLAKYKPIQIPLNINSLPTGVERQDNSFQHEGKTYVLVNAIGSQEIPDGKYLFDPGNESDRNSMGAGNRQRPGGGSAGAADGHGDQRNPESTPAVAIGLSRRFSRDRGGAAGRPFASLCRGLVYFDCYDHGHVRGRAFALDRGARDRTKERRRKRSQSRLAYIPAD